MYNGIHCGISLNKFLFTAMSTWYLYGKNLNPCITPHTETHSRCMVDLEECCPELSAVTEMFYKSAFSIMVAPRFLWLLSTSNVSSATEEFKFYLTFKLDFIKIKDFCLLKDTIKTEQASHSGEKLLAKTNNYPEYINEHRSWEKRQVVLPQKNRQKEKNSSKRRYPNANKW